MFIYAYLRLICNNFFHRAEPPDDVQYNDLYRGQ